MKNTYLVRVMTGPMAGTLKTASLEEWVSILRKNKGLPPESRRYFIIDCIIEDEELDRMYIEVDRDAYDEWHRDNQAAYRNRMWKKLFLHLSMDTVIDETEGVTLHDYVPSEYSVEKHAYSNLTMATLRAQLSEWKPWGLDLLNAYLVGDSKLCTKDLATKYKVSEQTIRKYKRQFKNFVKNFFKGVSF